MPKKDTLDVQKIFHYLPFETLFHLELGVEAYGCSYEALLTNIVAAFWDKKREEIEGKLSQQAYRHIEEKTIKRYGGLISDVKE